MSDEPQEVRSLREALDLTPDNRHIRRMLADALSKTGRFAPAVDEYRECLRQAPDDASTLLALAGTYEKFGKHNEALVIIEQLLKSDAPPSCENPRGRRPRHLLLDRKCHL